MLGYKRLWDYRKFHTPYNLERGGSIVMLDKGSSRIITYIKWVLGRYISCAPLPPLLTPNSSFLTILLTQMAYMTSCGLLSIF